MVRANLLQMCTLNVAVYMLTNQCIFLAQTFLLMSHLQLLDRHSGAGFELLQAILELTTHQLMRC
jgi:hypothetical protein